MKFIHVVSFAMVCYCLLSSIPINAVIPISRRDIEERLQDCSHSDFSAVSRDNMKFCLHADLCNVESPDACATCFPFEVNGKIGICWECDPTNGGTDCESGECNGGICHRLCTQDSDCPFENIGGYCDDGKCFLPCMDDSDCDAGTICDTDTLQCRPN